MSKATKPRTAALARRLTLLYMAALGTIALLTIVGQIVVQQAIVQLEGDSRIVNIAGRQRMLSQRLTRPTLELAFAEERPPTATATHVETTNNIRTDLNMWTQNHKGLQHGSDQVRLPGENSHSVKELFQELSPHFATLRKIIESTLARFESGGDAGVDKVRSELSHHSDAFLAGMDRIVSQLENEARNRVSRLRGMERALLFATITVLICEGLFVFSPTVTSLGRSITTLEDTSDELKRAKDIAENANSAKTEFLARVSHELRTPLHALLGMLGMVEKSKLSRDQQTQIRLANDASNSLLSLVNDLLDVASIEQGREIALNPQVVDLPALLTSIAEVMRPMAVQKGLHFQLNLDPALSNMVSIDTDRVRQVLTNLLQNAIRYTTAGSVRFQATTLIDAKRDLLRLTVEDTGIGISTDDQEHIFTSFSRGSNAGAFNSFGRSVGLGLSITKALVTQLGGTIALKSEVGRGSQFAVTIPISIANLHKSQTGTFSSQVQPSARLSRPPNQARPTALIVDDSPTNLLVMRTFLKKLGYRTMSVNSLKLSIEKFRRHRFDLVLMDRHLSDGDGIDFLNTLLGSNKSALFVETRVFLVTADIHLTAKSDPRVSSFAGVLHKPISFAELESAIGFHSPNETASNRDNGGPHFLESLKRKLARNVVERLSIEMESLTRMLSHSDYIGIEFLSHRMIGSAGNAGLTDLASLAIDLNDAASQRDRPKIEIALSRLATQLPQLS